MWYAALGNGLRTTFMDDNWSVGAPVRCESLVRRMMRPRLLPDGRCEPDDVAAVGGPIY
jgi:hypothetical protein